MLKRLSSKQVLAFGVASLVLASAQSPSMPDNRSPVEIRCVHITQELESGKNDAVLATIYVDVATLDGSKSVGAVKLHVGTYSADPPGNNVSYSPDQTKPLEAGAATFIFTATPTEHTVPGRITVQANIAAVSSGLPVRVPDEEPSRMRGSFTTAVR